MNRQIVFLFLCAIAFSSDAIAAPTSSPSSQPAPVPLLSPPKLSGPSSAPSTGPAPRRIAMPPGFVRFDVAERTVICQPADKAWVTKALTDLQPSTRPTTMPSDLADVLSSQREQLLKQMSADLGLTDSASIRKLIDGRLIPDLLRMADIHPPLIYMVCTRAKLVELMRSGWSDPRFYYNRAADDVTVLQAVSLSIERAMDDLLIPTIVDPAENPAQRSATLQRQIDRNEANIAASLSMQGQILLQSGLVAAIDEAAIKPLNFKPGQEWFGVGVEGLFSTRYMTQINGVQQADLLRVLTSDDPRNPIRASTISLLHPIPAASLRNDYAPAYIDAFRRRAITVTNQIDRKAGPGALAKILIAMRQTPPADGDALVALIKKTIGMDVSADVVPQR